MNSKPMSKEIGELQKRIRFIVHRLEGAIANHEFEKARFYSEEERKQRSFLQLESAKYGITPATANTVTRDDIEATLSRMTGLSIAAIQATRSEPDPDATEK